MLFFDYIENEFDITNTRPGKSGISNNSPAGASVVSSEPAAIKLPVIPAGLGVAAGPFGRD